MREFVIIFKSKLGIDLMKSHINEAVQYTEFTKGTMQFHAFVRSV